MIDLLNKLLSQFNLQVVKSSTEEPPEEPPEERDFLHNITTPEFAQKYPDFLDRYLFAKKHKSLYVGDINYIQDKKGKPYFKDQYNKYYCDYDTKNPSNVVLNHMINETTFTEEELRKKLNE